MHKLGSGNLMSEGGFPDLDADVRSNYLMNTSVIGFEEADVILLIGTNPRLEAPVFNARYCECTVHTQSQYMITCGAERSCAHFMAASKSCAACIAMSVHL